MCLGSQGDLGICVQQVYGASAWVVVSSLPLMRELQTPLLLGTGLERKLTKGRTIGQEDRGCCFHVLEWLPHSTHCPNLCCPSAPHLLRAPLPGQVVLQRASLEPPGLVKWLSWVLPKHLGHTSISEAGFQTNKNVIHFS